MVGDLVKASDEPDPRRASCRGELGTFATLISRIGPGRRADAAEQMTAMEVNEALGYLWPRLQELAAVMPDLYRVEMS
jgi:hypothetical protein